MSIVWLRDYFTDAEIMEYKSSFLKKFFKKDVCGKGETPELSRERKRRGNSAAKKCIKTQRQGNGKAKK